MKALKKLTKISLKLITMILIMVIFLAFGKYGVKYEVEAEVEPEKPDYLTFEALEDGSKVGFYIDNTTESFQYQKFTGEAWGEWSVVTETGPSHITFVDLSRGEKLRFKGKNASVHFGGTEGSDGLVLDGYIKEGKVKVFGDITSVTNEIGGLDKLDENEANYQEIFKGCTGLVSAEELVLPLTKLSNGCYSGMFLGCENLEKAPKLPAIELADSCYSSMFKDCTKLTVAPELPATTVADLCYFEMFIGCTSLTTAPKLPAKTLAPQCYSRMFKDCKKLITAPELPATKLADYCYLEMFKGCTNLQNIPSILPAKTLAQFCYMGMFSGCESITVAPELPAKTLADNCYQEMFNGCTNLQNIPTILPAKTLAQSCYSEMFSGCESITVAPELPATVMKITCYLGMFLDCKSLVTAPELPAEVVAEGCYNSMFDGCENLKKCTKVLPATTLAEGCYSGMFKGCKKLRRIPKLPATKLADKCYSSMFMDCTSITIVPEFPEGMQFAQLCFEKMFKGCEKLAVIPSLTILDWEEPLGVYGELFAGCTRLDISDTKDENYDRPWRIDGPGEDKYESYAEYDDAVFYSIGYMFVGCKFDCGAIGGVSFFDDDGSMTANYLLPNKTYYLKTYRHNITIEESENGTVTIDKDIAAEDEVLKLTVTPLAGYAIDRWEVSEDVEVLDDNTFVMPDKDVKIKAIFKKIVNVWPTASASYNQKLSDISIINNDENVEGTFRWKNPDTILDKIGVYKYEVIFTPLDTVKYYAVEGEVEVTVDKALYTPSKEYVKSYLYNAEYLDEIIDLTQFVKTNAGKVTFTIVGKTFTGSNTLGSVSIDNNKLIINVSKMDSFADNTSIVIEVKVSSDNYKDYIQKIIIKRGKGEGPTPETGDMAPFALYEVMMLGSIVALASVMFTSKKRRS